ncbi:MAG: YggT family protein [Anaerovoracaceae bacterium]|jgi:YggT family protein|nr:YggT family protein [Clostridiales bacterium]
MTTILLMRAVNLFFQVLIYLIIGRAILSWFIRAPYGNLYRFYNVIIQLTEPILAPCRSILARFGLVGAIDFSPILAIIGLTMINGFIINILRLFIF